MTDLLASEAYLRFWREPHLCTVTTLRPDGTPHVVPMGIVLDEENRRAWGITSGGSRKARNIAAAGPEGAAVAVCQVDGRRWATLEGRAVVLDDAESVREAEWRYAARYRQPRENPSRVAVRITLTCLLGTVPADLPAGPEAEPGAEQGAVAR
jgi:PPOX class probable F420-dependent enzyme